MTALQRFRSEIDDFMRWHPQSPLDHQQRHDFAGLNYYEPNEALVLEVTVERLSEDEPPVVMQTSTGTAVEYRRWGRFTFEVDGQEASLTIYSDRDGDEFFLPFRDATSAKETYEAGRYLDNHRPGLYRLGPDRFEVDFNYAYNPYCAYSEYYTCPLPPFENWLKLPIRAGEKRFK